LLQYAHLVEYTEGARRQTVAACLVARELGAVHEEDIHAAPAQEVRRGGPSRTGANNHYVVHARQEAGRAS
jgi:hypothetical protein